MRSVMAVAVHLKPKEQTMQKHHGWLRIGGGIVISVFFVVVGLQGCIKMSVVCPPGGGGSSTQDGKTTGCNRAPMVYTGSADGFWNDDTNQVIQPGSGLTCGSGSNKCRSGSVCLDTGQACVSHYTGGTCYCGC